PTGTGRRAAAREQHTPPTPPTQTNHQTTTPQTLQNTGKHRRVENTTHHTKTTTKILHPPDTPRSSSILFAFIALCQICSSHGSLILDKLSFIVGRISARDHME
ncbi:hypothetical protein OCH74_07910, partial [Bifidobacterium thermacidophilum]